MSNRKIRILGIAPYEAMKISMQKLADERTDLELDVYSGDMNYGTEIVKHNLHNHYDVIISRGGTAELIGKSTSIPVIEISLSVYDILRSIKLAENYSKRYAIVGFPSITSSAHLLCDLLQYQIDIVTIHNATEVTETLNLLKQNGYHMVVCDMITHTTAKTLGLNAILITSGIESIQNAFDQAVKISTSYLKSREENIFLENILRGENSYTMVFDEKDEVYLSTWDKENTHEVYTLLRSEIPHVSPTSSYKIFRNINGILFSVTGCIIPYQEQNYTVFYFTASKIPIASGKYGIQFSNKQEAEEHFFNSFYSITGAMGELQHSIALMSQSSFPIMVLGELGTGKEQIARVVYTQSQLSHNPLVIIDCMLLNTRSWEYLTNHYNSPLNDNNNTLYFKNVEALSEERHRQLLSLIIDTNLSKRNRILFSCTSKDSNLIPPSCQELIRRLSCLTICLPPLRERITELPALSSLYLGTLNMMLGKQLIGFEPLAMELLEHYDWPHNYAQFKRLLGELATITNTSYISQNDVATLLTKEKSILGHNSSLPSTSTHLDLNRTLDEITRDIVHHIVSECKGNQTAAAKQLGISRTTLWRYLNRN